MPRRDGSESGVNDTLSQSHISIAQVSGLLKRVYTVNGGYIDAQGRYAHRIPPTLTDADLQQLREARCPPNAFVDLAHDVAVARLRELAAGIDVRRAADTFVASLASAGPEWQAVLPAFALGLALPPHPASAMSAKNAVCSTCFHDARPRDRTEAAYLRHQDGSGWSDDIGGPLSALLTLEDAASLPLAQWPQPTPRDIWVLHRLLDTVRALPVDTRYSAARTAVKAAGLLQPGTIARCGSWLEALGFIGVLETPEHPGLLTRFTSARERDQRPNDGVEVPAPLAWWNAGNGLNERLLQQLFDHLVRPEREPAPTPKAKQPRQANTPRTALPKAVAGPIAAGDIYAVRVYEDLWTAVYCHRVKTCHRGKVWGRVEFLDVTSPTPPAVEVATAAGYRNRSYEPDERWQSWCGALDKTSGVRRIAAGVAPPASPFSEPDQVGGCGAGDLRHLATSHFQR